MSVTLVRIVSGLLPARPKRVETVSPWVSVSTMTNSTVLTHPRLGTDHLVLILGTRPSDPSRKGTRDVRSTVRETQELDR